MDSFRQTGSTQRWANGLDSVEGLAHLPGCSGRIEALLRVSRIIPRLMPRTQISVGRGDRVTVYAFQDDDGPAEYWCVSASAPSPIHDEIAWREMLWRAGI